VLVYQPELVNIINILVGSSPVYQPELVGLPTRSGWPSVQN